MSGARSWRLGKDRNVTLEPWCLMGILNATPDSFSDGGDHLDPERAISTGLGMIEAGATVLDVGGESTRPGAASVSVSEQIDRVVPVIEGIRRRSAGESVAITIDTTRAAVAEAAFDAGADALNDVSAGTEDPDVLGIVADRGRGIVLMHRLKRPADDAYSDAYERPPVYADVVEDVLSYLRVRVDAAIDAGIDSESVAIDPGLGFGKSVDQNLRLVAGLPAFVETGHPVLVGGSRKRFLGATSGTAEARDRDPESAVLAVEAWRAGARFFRVHDVGIHERSLRIVAAVERAGRVQGG
ncbi:MAG: dihydropteroate synthase [Planctomycetaceae bacterium]|nr:dihydropteroate synthase [Planctomycetaceae bacterium]